ncbi:zinc finger protein Eos [Aplochiton taeniatus]
MGEGTRIGYSRQTSPKPVSPHPIRMSNGKLQCDECGIICIGPNVLMVHKRSHTGERPFECSQCGASFTQKGNLLRHTKLHSGEKPFKCPFCKYACRRRDALTGHIRTHSGKESLVLEPITAPVLQLSSEKPILADRLANGIAKRKRSTPQKFLGEKHMQLHVLEAPFELSSGSDVEHDLFSSPLTEDLAGSVGMGRFPPLGSSGGAKNPEPSKLSMTQPASMSKPPLVLSSIFSHVAPQDAAAQCAGESEVLAGWETGEDQEAMPSTRSPTASPSNGCLDTESTAEEQSKGAAVLTNNSNHLLYSTPILPCYRKTTSHTKGSELEWDRICTPRLPHTMSMKSFGSPPTCKEVVQVVDVKGRVVHSFRCEHCRILFMDHVVFTIHMGCHGFRHPFECNICGYRSADRYEFASHISRGEHHID